MTNNFQLFTVENRIKRLLFVLFFIITSFLFLFLYPKAALATVFLEDNFNDGDANDGNPVDWEEFAGPQGGWWVENGEYVGTVVKECGSDIFSYALAGDFLLNNYSFSVRIKGTDGVDKKIMFRYQSNGTRYDVNLINGGSINLQKWLNGSSVALWWGGFNTTSGQWYTLRVEALGKNIKVFVENQKIIDITDEAGPILNGKIGLQIWPGYYAGCGGRTTTRFDDVIVTSLEPTPTPLLVPYLSQKSEPWGWQEYNQAHNWSANPTISRWGCALTSAAMTLLYHGINKIPGGETLNPGTLNDWLNSQLDGYLREGQLNWYALTRLARIVHGEIGSTLLQFRRAGKDFNLLDEDLATNQPPILEEPGHFIIATGKTDGSYFINDPAWQAKTTLVAYGNNFNSLRRLIPSATNLSTVLLVSNPNVNLKLTDQFGNPVGQSYLEGPLEDAVSGGQTSGQGLRVLDFPQPPGGAYIISVSSPNTTLFNLDIYSYDQAANATTSSFFGLSSSESPITFQLTRTEEGETQAIERIITFEQTKVDIKHALTLGLIRKGTTNSLTSKLNSAERAKSQGHTSQAKKHLEGFLEELERVKNKGLVDFQIYLLLKESGEYLLAHL